MSSPEKLIKQGRFYEAAQIFHQKADNAKSIFEGRRYLDSAARCYESANEYSSAVMCFLEAGNLEAALKACIKSKDPKPLSRTLLQRGKPKEAVRSLIICSLNFFKERNFIEAKNFCEEALNIGHSQLPEALINVIEGVIENDPEKISTGLKIGQTASGEDFDLISEITFIAKNALAEITPAQLMVTPKTVQEERKLAPLYCPNCGAPFSKQKAYSKVIQCDYCRHVTRL